MTLTIDITLEAESRLEQESERTGIPVPELAGRLLMERLQPGTDRINNLIADISAPIDVADVSRETIYAE
jgi:hypothetical protein